MYIFMKVFYKTNLLMYFHISKPNNLKVIHDLYSQFLTQILSKNVFFYQTGGIPPVVHSITCIIFI
jgi:hypothetical protein